MAQIPGSSNYMYDKTFTKIVENAITFYINGG